MSILKSNLEEQVEALLKKDHQELLFLLSDLMELINIIKRVMNELNQIFSQIIQLKAELYRKKKEYSKTLFRIDNDTRLMEKRREIEHKMVKLREYIDKEVIKKEKHEINIEKMVEDNLDLARKKLDKLK